MNLRYALAAALAALPWGGCAATPPAVQTETTAAQAIALPPGEAIRVLNDAQPDDVASPVTELTLPLVIALSAQQSPQIQVAMARVRVAQAEARQARLLPNPVVNLALRFPESGTTIIDAGLSADLIAVLEMPGAISSADARLRASSAEALTVVLDTVSAAQDHFVTIQSLESAGEIQRQRRELLDRLLGLAESRLNIGEGTRLDVLTLRTQRVELDVEAADQQLELREQRLALARAIGQPTAAAEWRLATWTPPSDDLPSETELIRRALENRPEVQQRTWELEAFGFDRKLTGWGIVEGAEIGVEAERDDIWSVGPAVSFPVPLLDMGQAQQEAALARVVEARHELTAARRQVIEDVRRAYATVASVRANLRSVRDQLIPLQDERLQQAEAQFRAGQTDITGLLIAEQDVRASRVQLIDLQRRFALARVRLERAVGGAGPLVGPATSPSNPRNP